MNWKILEDYRTITEKNPDLEKYLSTREIFFYAMGGKAQDWAKAYRLLKKRVRTNPHPRAPKELIDKNLQRAYVRAAWGVQTKGTGPKSSFAEQLKLGHTWQAERARVLQTLGVEQEQTLRQKYTEFLKGNPDALTHLSTKEILRILLGKEPKIAECQEIRRSCPFERHPRIPHHIINKNIPKKDSLGIWRLRSKGFKKKELVTEEILTQEKEIAAQWWKKRCAFCTQSGIPSERPLPDGIDPKDFETLSYAAIGRKLGVSRQRAHQMQTEYFLPRINKNRNRELVRDWLKNNHLRLAEVTLETIQKESGTKLPIPKIRRMLVKSKLCPERHPIFDADLRLRTCHLVGIYSCRQYIIMKARKNAKAEGRPYAAEPTNTNYENWIKKETEKAESTVKIWKLINPTSGGTCPKWALSLDWSKSAGVLEKESGKTLQEIHEVRLMLKKPLVRNRRNRTVRPNSPHKLLEGKDLSKTAKTLWIEAGKPTSFGYFINVVTQLRKKQKNHE